MTKFIAVLIIVAVLYGGWELFFYWEKVKNDEESEKKQAIATAVVPEQLPGMSFELEQSLRTAQGGGAANLKNWLKAQGNKVQDPRRAWIELDYCVMISQADPAEARRVFSEVKRRTSETSPIWPRIKKLEKTYE